MFNVLIVVILVVLYFSLNKRLKKLEKKLGLAQPEPVAAESSTASQQLAPVKEESKSLLVSAVAMPALTPQPSSLESESPKVAEKNWEELIGKRWLPLLGIGAVVVGVSFFLKYAFENNLIGETGRVVLGLLAGLALVGLGEYWRRKYEKYSWVLMGGGIALCYLSIYAAYSFYQLIGQPAAFGFMIAVTAFATVLAVRHRAMPLMIVAMLGGYFTPSLLAVEKSALLPLLFYCAVLNVGFLTVTALRRWKPLMILGIAGGFIVPLPLVGDQSVMLGWFTYLALFNAFILAVAILKKWRLMNLLGLLGSLLAFVVWYGSHYRPIELAQTELFLSVVFIEYLAATLICVLTAKEKSSVGDLGLLTINAGWYFAWSYFLLKPNYDAYLGLFTAIMAMVYLSMAYGAMALKKFDSYLTLVLGGIALVFLTLVFPIQLHGYWITIAWAAESVALAILGARSRSQKIRLAALAVMSIALVRLFIFDSAVLDIVNYTIFLNQRFFSFAVVIAALVALKYVFRLVEPADIQGGDMKGEESLGPILISVANILFLFVLSLEVVAFYDAKIANAVLTGQVANQSLSAGYHKNYAVITYQYNDAAVQPFINQRNAILSAFWALYATVALIIGMVRRCRYVRYGALGLLGITLFKVVLVDLAVLPTLYRFISLVILGVLLLVGAYFYQSNKSKFLTN